MQVGRIVPQPESEMFEREEFLVAFEILSAEVDAYDAAGVYAEAGKPSTEGLVDDVVLRAGLLDLLATMKVDPTAVMVTPGTP